MRLETQSVIIRAFAKKDAERLYSIVREASIRRFMPDWSDGHARPQDYHDFIARSQKQQDNADISILRAYAIALPGTDEMIGMVAVGLKEKLNEIELAYFMSEEYQVNGYAGQSVNALAQWCFEVSDIPYLILTISCANDPSNKLAQKCGFELFERRTPIGYQLSNAESDSYFYYRKYRK